MNQEAVMAVKSLWNKAVLERLVINVDFETAVSYLFLDEFEGKRRVFEELFDNLDANELGRRLEAKDRDLSKKEEAVNFLLMVMFMNGVRLEDLP